MANNNRLTRGEASVGNLVVDNLIQFSDTTEQVTAYHGYFGAFSSYQTQSLGSANASVPFTFDTIDGSKNVRLVDNSKVTFDHTGVYNIQWSGQFQNTSTNAEHDVFIWLKINDDNVIGSTGKVSVIASHAGIPGHVLPAWNYVLSMNKNDYLEFYWSSDSTAVTLLYGTANTNPPYPSTASVILTAVEI